MNVSIYMKGCYEEFSGFGLRKNKANSKPIKANSVRPLDVGVELPD